MMLASNVLCVKKRKKRSYCLSNVSDYVGKYRDKRTVILPAMMHITEDTPPDMLEGAMDLTVHLPNGRAVKMSVERSTPMMDVLVQITTSHQLQISNYAIHALGMAPLSGHNDNILPFKANTPIGTLETQHIRVVPKNRSISASRIAPATQQPFESTFRLKVHLPRNQLYVHRVSKSTNLGQIMCKVCDEKNLDPEKYEFRHPGNLDEVLDPKLTLADYQITEIYAVLKGATRLSQTFSAQDIMALRKEDDRKNSKSSGGVFSLFFKRGKSNSGSLSSENRSISPSHSDDSRSGTPPATQPPLEKPKPPQRKRRPAPKPPQIKEESKKEHPVTICHSRNSSDSSGYHEASILSDANASLPRRPQIISEENRRSLNGEFSRSTGNLAMMSNQSKSTCSLALAGRKKKAPPPPPKTATVENASPVVASRLEKQDLPLVCKDLSKAPVPLPRFKIKSPGATSSDNYARAIDSIHVDLFNNAIPLVNTENSSFLNNHNEDHECKNEIILADRHERDDDNFSHSDMGSEKSYREFQDKNVTEHSENDQTFLKCKMHEDQNKTNNSFHNQSFIEDVNYKVCPLESNNLKDIENKATISNIEENCRDDDKQIDEKIDDKIVEGVSDISKKTFGIEDSSENVKKSLFISLSKENSSSIEELSCKIKEKSSQIKEQLYKIESSYNYGEEDSSEELQLKSSSNANEELLFVINDESMKNKGIDTRTKNQCNSEEDHIRLMKTETIRSSNEGTDINVKNNLDPENSSGLTETVNMSVTIKLQNQETQISSPKSEFQVVERHENEDTEDFDLKTEDLRKKLKGIKENSQMNAFEKTDVKINNNSIDESYLKKDEEKLVNQEVISMTENDNNLKLQDKTLNNEEIKKEDLSNTNLKQIENEYKSCSQDNDEITSEDDEICNLPQHDFDHPNLFKQTSLPILENYFTLRNKPCPERRNKFRECRSDILSKSYEDGFGFGQNIKKWGNFENLDEISSNNADSGAWLLGDSDTDSIVTPPPLPHSENPLDKIEIPSTNSPPESIASSLATTLSSNIETDIIPSNEEDNKIKTPEEICKPLVESPKIENLEGLQSTVSDEKSDVHEELQTWQYQLPSPPKAFRDDSPVLAEQTPTDSIITSPELFEKLKLVKETQSETSEIPSIASEEDMFNTLSLENLEKRKSLVYNRELATSFKYSEEQVDSSKFENANNVINELEEVLANKPEKVKVVNSTTVTTTKSKVESRNLPNFKITTYNEPKKNINIFEDDSIRSNANDTKLKRNISMENLVPRRESLEDFKKPSQDFNKYRSKTLARTNEGLARSESLTRNTWVPINPVKRSKSQISINYHQQQSEEEDQPIVDNSLSKSNSLFDVSGLQSLEVMRKIQTKLNSNDKLEENKALKSGPPSINLGTWSDRPRSSLPSKTDTTTTNNNVSIKINGSESITTRSGNVIIKIGGENNVQLRKPLDDVKNKVDRDISRVPIVRSVELKKPFRDFHPNKSVTQICPEEDVKSLNYIINSNNKINRINSFNDVGYKTLPSKIVTKSENYSTNKNVPFSQCILRRTDSVNKLENNNNNNNSNSNNKSNIFGNVVLRRASNANNYSNRFSTGNLDNMYSQKLAPTFNSAAPLDSTRPISKVTSRPISQIIRRQNSYTTQCTIPESKETTTGPPVPAKIRPISQSIPRPPAPPTFPKQRPQSVTIDPRSQLLSDIINFGGKKGLKAVNN